MRLSSLELQGFKSFPDKTRLEFGDGITAVVGPNGSGKSNIADAVRWVLGEQSTKTLRGGKMEDVIFGGTQTRKSVGYAMVQLTIDNSDGDLAEQEKEITISRRLYRSGESEYRIGGNMVRLRDIHELFMDTGLGRDGYSIIGQGRIAEIVSAKSGSRREIFEEAAGIAKFRYRRTEAERRLAAAQENLLRLTDILTELEDRVGPLRVQSEKAREFLTLAEERKGLEISLWMLSLEQLRGQLSQQQNNVLIAKNDYEQLELEGQRLEESINDAYRKMQERSAESDRLRGEIRTMEEDLSSGEARIAVLYNDIGHNQSRIGQLEEELGGMGPGGEETQRLLTEKEQERADALTELEQLRGRMTANTERLEEQRTQIARTEEELRQLQVRKESLESAMAELRLEQAAGATRMAESSNRLEDLRKNSTVHNSAVEEYKDSIAECNKQIEEAQGTVDALENTRSGYALKRESRERKRAELQHAMDKLVEEGKQKVNRAKLLEDLEANMEGFAGSVKYILSQSGRGALRGVHGVVSSIISTEGEYATAIEIALGPAMQNVVVENEETAKRAISMLREAKTGRATFLPITSVKGRESDFSHLKKHGGFIGVASRLVRADGRFQGIVDQLLGRICVVDDLDTGTAIAKENGYKFRIVTLDGQVINAGGSYTGGSTARSAGVLGRRSEIERLHAEAEELRGKVREMEPGLRSVGEELSSLDAALSGTVAEIQSAQEDKVRLGFQLEQLERSLVQAEQNRELAAKEVEALTGRLAELREGDDSSAKLLEETQGRLDALGEETASVGNRLATLRVGSETTRQALSEQQMSELSAQKDSDALEQELARLREELENADARSERLRREQRELRDKNAAIEEEITRLGEDKTVVQGRVARSNGEIARLSAERTALEKETTGLRAKDKELSGRREEVSRELVRLEERVRAVQSEYDGIISKLWDEYELTRSQAAEVAEALEDVNASQRRLNELRSKIRALGSVNVAAIEEFAEVNERYTFLAEQVADVTASKEQLETLIGELTGEMRSIFQDSFVKIAAEFSKVFTELFGGGKGQLVLTDDTDDVLEAGVEIHVQPPGKVIKNLSLLSGGEQAFVAIAIYFAILKVKPAPFVLLDEIEAALDDVNVVRFASYLRQMCDKSQFIAITHRRGTMEEADVLYGVTMQEEGVSKLLELRIHEVERKLNLEGQV